jgi:hypothetical protein
MRVPTISIKKKNISDGIINSGEDDEVPEPEADEGYNAEKKTLPTFAAGLMKAISLNTRVINLEKNIEEIKVVLHSRTELHKFIIDSLNILDFHWNSSDDSLSFFVSFFKMLEILILRKFFHPKHDDFIRETILKADPMYNVEMYSRENP